MEPILAGKKVLLASNAFDKDLSDWNGASAVIESEYGWLNGEPTYVVVLESGDRLLVPGSSLELA